MAGSPIEQILGMFDTEPVDDEPVDDLEPIALGMATGMSTPVPDSFGKLWKKRIDDALEVYKVEHAKWDALYALYRECGIENNDNEVLREYRYHAKNNTDENILRDNMKATMRSTYMQNPHIEFTAQKPEDTLVDCLSEVSKFMLNKKTYPGLNMKPKARRWVLHSLLTNHGCMRLDYQAKEGSLQEAQIKLNDIEGRLQKAKSTREIEKLMAELQLLYEQMPLLDPKGVRITNVLPHKVLIDPNCNDLDLDTAWWLVEFFDLDRDFVKKKFFTEDDEGQIIRRANNKPVDSDNVDRETTEDVSERVFDTIDNVQTDEREAVIQKNKVECCYVYDKLTRRIYLFSTEDWSYPLWVFEDDLKLSRFFRHFFLGFSEALEGVVQPGEPSFYVGQIHEINKINRKAKEIRDSAFGALIFNKGAVDEETVKKLINHLRNPDKVEAFGITKDETKKLNEIMEVFVPPAFDYEKLFNTQSLRTVIDRNANVSAVDRGEQFKTNTTNKAVEYYDSQKQQANSIYIENIEDAFESLAWAIAEILVSKYTKEEIVDMVGPDLAEGFTTMSVEEFNRTYRMTVAAGSIEKPTTEFKKKEAISIAQAIGQVGQATPATTLKIILRMFQTAFSSFLVKKEDFKMLETEATANLQKGVSTNGPEAAPQPQQQQ